MASFLAHLTEDKFMVSVSTWLSVSLIIWIGYLYSTRAYYPWIVGLVVTGIFLIAWGLGEVPLSIPVLAAIFFLIVWLIKGNYPEEKSPYARDDQDNTR